MSNPHTYKDFRKEVLDWEDKAVEILGPCPPDLRETTVDITLADGFISRTIIIHPVPSASSHPENIEKCPLIVFFHGGSFAFGTPRFALSPARAFASYFRAIVACPTYKLAPENVFPAPMKSAWEVAAWLSDPDNLKKQPVALDGVAFVPSLGFILAGSSAGASIAAVLAGVAAAAKAGNEGPSRGLSHFSTPITGLFISLPHIVHRDMVPLEHASAFRSRDENETAPIISAKSLAESQKRLQTDVHSPWFSPLNLDLAQLKDHHPQKVYVHVGELDVLRDDGVIYERVLREEKIAETRIDRLAGYGHVGWVSLPFPEAHTTEIKEMTMNGMAWLLEKGWNRDRPLPY
jgi:acetyl esterase/lipase